MLSEPSPKRVRWDDSVPLEVPLTTQTAGAAGVTAVARLPSCQANDAIRLSSGEWRRKHRKRERSSGIPCFTNVNAVPRTKTPHSVVKGVRQVHKGWRISTDLTEDSAPTAGSRGRGIRAVACCLHRASAREKRTGIRFHRVDWLQSQLYALLSLVYDTSAPSYSSVL